MRIELQFGFMVPATPEPSVLTYSFQRGNVFDLDDIRALCDVLKLEDLWKKIKNLESLPCNKTWQMATGIITLTPYDLSTVAMGDLSVIVIDAVLCKHFGIKDYNKFMDVYRWFKDASSEVWEADIPVMAATLVLE